MNLRIATPWSFIRAKAQMLTTTWSLSFKMLRDFEQYGVHRRAYATAVIFGAGARGLMILQFGLIYKVLSALTTGNRSSILKGPSGHVFRWIIPHALQETAWVWVFLIAAVLLIKGLEIALGYRADRFLFDARRRVQSTVDERIFERALRVSFSFFDRRFDRHGSSWGDVVRFLAQNSREFANQVRAIHQFHLNLLSVGLFSALVIAINWRMFALIIAIIPICRYLGGRVMGTLHSAAQAERRAVEAHQNSVGSVIGAVVLVRSSAMEQREIDRFRRSNQLAIDEAEESAHMDLLEGPINGVSKLFSMGVMASTTPMLPSLGSRHKVSASFICTMVLQQIENGIDAIIKNMKSLLAYPKQKEDIDALCGDESRAHLMIEGPQALTCFRHAVEIRALDFAYAGRKVLDQMSLRIERGKTTAIVGATGSGKSTLAKVLLRLYNLPDGKLFIDGHDVNQLTLQSVRKLFAYVPQDPTWLQGSVRENLIYGLERTVTDDEIRAACEQTGVWEAITRNPKALDAPMGLRGGAFSGGELQCLSLARALLRDAEIMLLDEPTSALDAIAEVQAQTAIERVMATRTVIVIAHRLSTIARADHVICLANGKILEQGSIPQLLRKRGGFHALWQRQGEFWSTLKAG